MQQSHEDSLHNLDTTQQLAGMLQQAANLEPYRIFAGVYYCMHQSLHDQHTCTSCLAPCMSCSSARRSAQS
jgi:hypothetical protein